ncbi:MAG: response regulator [Cytophagales bacterium]|jgi:CheY-like chemotaxis protein|nr:response regulator [Cytophagales bacterium]
MKPCILVAEDDADDRFLLHNAFSELKISDVVAYVKDGVELIDQLNHRLENDSQNPLPSLILLDLNMPRKNGMQALAEIKADPALRLIPVLIFTTSAASRDIEEAYSLGANSYIVKPSDYAELTDLVKTIRDFWLGSVRLPKRSGCFSPG